MMKRLLTFAIVFALGCEAAVGLTRSGSGAAAPQDTLIRNATVLTVSHGPLQNTDVLIRGGTIVAVGQNLKAPDGARVIDATGRYVLPGIIVAHSHSMMDGSVNKCTKSVTSMARTQDILNP